MAKKTPALAATPKHGLLDLWHKGFYPALALIVGIVVGSFTVYFGFARQATEKEVERLKIEVQQHAEQEQQAKDETQWLRVEIAKHLQREKSSLAHMPHVEGQNNDAQAAVIVALWLANLTGKVDALKQNDAEKFGEEVKELWEKAVKKAEEDKPIDFTKM